MKTPILLALALTFSAGLWAQSAGIEGEVIKIDLGQARLTLKHGEFRKLDMPPMTMVYRVAQPQLLRGVTVGDRVRFEAERVDGVYTVTALSPARRP